MPGYSTNGYIFENLWKSTRTKYSSDIINMLPRSHPLLAKIAGNDNIVGKNGETGKRVVETIVARPLKNCEWTTIDTNLSAETENIFEQIEWDWKIFVQTFKVYDMELAMNRSAAIADLLDNLQQAAKHGMIENFNRQLYSAGLKDGTTLPDPLKMGGLQYLLNENPYQPGLVVLGLQRGGAPGDRYEFWRNRSGQIYSDKWSAANITPEQRGTMLYHSMDKMIDILQTQNGNKIDGIYCNDYLWDCLKAYIEQKIYINNVLQQKEEIGFAHINFRGIPVYRDPSCPSHKMFFLNSREIYFNYLVGQNVRHTTRDLPTQLGKLYITTFVGNLTLTKPRFQGMITVYPDKTKEELAALGLALPDDCNICDFDNFKDYDYEIIPQEQVGDGGVENKGYSASGRPTGMPTASAVTRTNKSK